MSLRLRLFLILAGLAGALLAAQVWWVRSLADEMASEVNTVAVTVGRAVASLVEPGRQPRGGTAAEGAEDDRVRHQVIVRLDADGAGSSTLPAIPPQLLARLTAAEDEEDENRRELSVIHLRGSADDVPVLTLQRPGLAGHRIPIPHGGLHDRLDRFGRRMITGTLALLALGLFAAAILAHRISAPLRQLATAAREVGHGRLGARVATPASGEVGEAIAAFDRMAERLELLDREARLSEEHRHLGEIGEVARGLAHSLRNPLHALGLSVEELADRAGADPEAAELAIAARRQIDRVDRALRSFLTLAGGGSAAAVAPVAALPLLDDIVLEAIQEGRGKTSIMIHRPSVEVEPVAAVEPELRAVIQALVINAVDASPPGAAVEIELAARQNAPGWRVRVLDRGAGLSDEVRERLFTPHLSTKPGGSGMGLYLAHRIACNRYGGRLELDDRPQGGTIVTLEVGPRLQATGTARERPGDES